MDMIIFRKEKNFLIVLFSQLIFSSVMLGQSIQPPTIVPPSPTAQTFMRYGEIPVDYSTGVPNIEIPVYTIEGNQLKIPISLSYHASGIKVNDIASEVGLGWALNCGGLVSRSINGRRDESNQLRTYNSATEFLNGLNAAANEPYNQSSGCLDGIRNFENFLIWNFSNDEEDQMKDRYFYKLPGGLSGVFTYDFLNENNVITLPYRPLKIEKFVEWTGSWFKIASFKITDDNGTVYTFQTYLTNPTQNYSEWLIKDMTSADGTDQITFNYVLQSSNPAPAMISQVYQGWAENTNSSCYPQNPSSSVSNSSFPFSEFSTPVLASITSSRAVVSFEYGSRNDFNYLKRLTKISIAPVNAPTNAIKEVQFDYKYFGSTNEDRRLGLDKIRITSPTEPQAQEHSFIYENEVLPPYPFKMTYPVYNEDFWGYNNGSNSVSLIPKEFISNVYDQQSYGGKRESGSYFSSKACMLKEIHYPTGGKTIFNFERHYSTNAYPYKADPYEKAGYIGGFRVASITNYSDNSTIANVKTYDYELPETRQIDISSFSYDQSYIEGGTGSPGTTCWARFSRKIVSSNPIIPLEVAPGMPIMYRKVTEYNGTLASHAGKTIYTYDQPYSPSDYLNNPDHPLQYEAPRCYHPYHYDKGNYVPEMNSKTTYSFDGTNYHPLSKEEYQYSKLFSTTFSTGIKLTRFKQFPGIDFWCYTCPIPPYTPTLCASMVMELIDEYKTSIVVIDTKAYQEASLLTNSKSYVYDPLYANNYILTSTDYTYNQSNVLVKEKSTHTSKGDLLKSAYKYPIDFPGTLVYDTMVNRNILSPLVEETLDKNGSFLQSTKTNFNFWNGTSWSTTATNIIVPQTVEARITPQTSYETRLRFESYNDKGQVITASKENDVKTTYIWGYNKAYPVAKIVGVGYSSLNGLFNQAVLDNPATTDIQMRNELNLIRSALSVTNALVATYTYKPLVGMTSETDPNGNTIYYEYDNFNRLVLIKDHDSKILKKICYNYAGQIENCLSPCTNLNPNWQNTTTPLRCQQGSCGNTGYQEQEQMDMNPCSSTYGATQWILAGYNPTACAQGSNVTITYQNETTSTGFVALYTNNATGQTYSFNVPASGNGTLGCVPAGIYSLSISKPGNMMLALFGTGCFTQSGTSAFFGKVNVSMCNTVIIGYDL